MAPGGARVLVVGGGAREHALVWKLAASPHVGALACAPGNPGIAELATVLPVAADDVAGLIAAARDWAADLVVIGPEAALAAGLADALTAVGIAVAGPTRRAARLESSKAFAKEVMSAAGVPTAAYRAFTAAPAAEAYVRGAALPLVVKADGLAAGKGVVVCTTRAEALAAVRAALRDRVFGAAGDRVVIEECLRGEEVSVLALAVGRQVMPLLPAQDHKRLLDGDLGPNTGGMGAVAPSAVLTAAELQEVRRTILEPTLAVLADQGIAYRGVLYAGLMRTAQGLRVLEFNCRFGDPEAQVLLPLLATDLYELLAGCAAGELPSGPLRWHAGAAAGVTLAAPGYPDAPRLGEPITFDPTIPDGVTVFHGGVGRDAAGGLVTAGGRVATVVGRGATVAEALARCLPPPLRFPDMHYRRDIGAHAHSAHRREIAPTPSLTHG